MPSIPDEKVASFDQMNSVKRRASVFQLNPISMSDVHQHFNVSSAGTNEVDKYDIQEVML